MTSLRHRPWGLGLGSLRLLRTKHIHTIVSHLSYMTVLYVAYATIARLPAVPYQIWAAFSPSFIIFFLEKEEYFIKPMKKVTTSTIRNYKHSIQATTKFYSWISIQILQRPPWWPSLKSVIHFLWSVSRPLYLIRTTSFLFNYISAEPLFHLFPLPQVYNTLQQDPAGVWI